MVPRLSHPISAWQRSANFAAEDIFYAVRVRRLVSAAYSSCVENLPRRVDSTGEQPSKGDHHARESRGRPRARTPVGKYDDNEAAGARPGPRPGLLPRQARAQPGRGARGWAALRGSVRRVPPLPLDGAPSGESTQMGFEVDDIDAVVAELRSRGVVFGEIDAPGFKVVDGIIEVEGNYPSKGEGERGIFFHDSEGNLLALGQAVG